MFLCGNVDSAAQEPPHVHRTLSSVFRALVSIPEAVLVNEFSSGENAGVVYYVIHASRYPPCDLADSTFRLFVLRLGTSRGLFAGGIATSPHCTARYHLSHFQNIQRSFALSAVLFLRLDVTTPQLISQCPEYSVEDIPSKTIFRASPDLVFRRRVQLEKFLQGVVKSEPLATSECTLQVSTRGNSVLHVSASHSLVQFFTPNRERRLLTMNSGNSAASTDGGETLNSDGQSGVCARQGGAAFDAAGDRLAVDWSGSFSRNFLALPHIFIHISSVFLLFQFFCGLHGVNRAFIRHQV
jgi:hypothetical protein